MSEQKLQEFLGWFKKVCPSVANDEVVVKAAELAYMKGFGQGFAEGVASVGRYTTPVEVANV